MGVNIDEILASLEQEKTAEANFADNISSENSEAQDNTSAEEAPEVAETSDNTETVNDTEEVEGDAEKIAEACDQQGRIMARAFVAEINKLASDNNEASEEVMEEVSETSEPVSNEEVETDQAEETDSEEKVAEADDSTPAQRIVGALYNDYFGGEE